MVGSVAKPFFAALRDGDRAANNALAHHDPARFFGPRPND